jgi:hypothetical protein
MKTKHMAVAALAAALVAGVAAPDAWARQGRRQQKKVEESSFYKRFDKDKNKKLDEAEKKAIAEYFKAHPTSTLLKKNDTDGDGQLSEAELAAIPATETD